MHCFRSSALMVWFLFFAWASPPANAQSYPLRFDMGPSGNLAAGYTAVTATTAHPGTSNPGDFGWTGSPALANFDRGTVDPRIVHNHDDDLIVDGVRATASYTFRVNVANGSYLCFAYLGDVGLPLSGMQITAEGTMVARGVFARTVNKKAQLSGLLGGYRRVAFLANVADGALDVTFGPSSCRVTGLEVFEYADPPVVYDHNLTPNPGYRVTAAYTGPTGWKQKLTEAIDDLNQFDYAAARQALDVAAALAGTNPRGKLGVAWGRAWLAGTLDGQMEAVDPGLMDEIRAGLVDVLALAPGNSSAASLYAELLDFELGYLFHQTRGYSPAVFPNPGSLAYLGGGGETGIVLNLCASVQLYEQMDDDILGTTGVATQTESPFFAKAQYLIARNMYSRGTHVTAGIGCPATSYHAYWLEIVDRLWPRLQAGPQRLYPEGHEAIVFCWLMQEFIGAQIGDLSNPTWPATCTNLLLGPNALMQQWTPAHEASYLQHIDPADTWWDGRTAEYTDPNAPLWARTQGSSKRSYRNIGEWWMEHRLYTGGPAGPHELGTGDGDDVEGAGALLAPSIAWQESGDNPRLEDPAGKVLRDVLYGSSVDVSEGYFQGSGDVEHAAEYTSYPLFALMSTQYGNPEYAEFTMRMMRNMEDLHAAGTAPWSTSFLSSTLATARHLTSWNFGSTAVSPSGIAPFLRDHVPNLKALLPGVTLLEFNASPTLERLFLELSRGWADVAMRTDAGKPAGVFPASVGMDGGVPGTIGNGTQWWVNQVSNGMNPFYQNFPAQLGYYGALYYLQVVSYRTNPEPILLDPLRRVVADLYGLSFDPNFVDGNPLVTTVGTQAWALFQLKSSIANVTWRASKELLGAGFPPPYDDPMLYPPRDIISRVVGQYSTGAAAQLFAASQTPGVTDKSTLENVHGDQAYWLRHFWPLATTVVTYTDRIKFSVPALHSLHETPSGGEYGFVPDYAISWSNPDSDATSTEADELEMALLLNRMTASSIEALIYNFKPTNDALRMQYWRGLGLGDFDVSFGPANPATDDFFTAPTPVTQTIDYAGWAIELDVPPGLHLLKLTKKTTIAGAGLSLDLAIEEEDLGLDGSNQLLVRVHNIGSVDYDPSAILANLIITLNGSSTTVPLNAIIRSPETTTSGLTPQSVIYPTGFQPTWSMGQDNLIHVEIQYAGTEITVLNNEATADLAP